MADAHRRARDLATATSPPRSPSVPPPESSPESGWDGVFVEDYVFFHDRRSDTYDPWVTLSAVALATERVRIGTLVTPLPSRRVWKPAAEAVAIDHLSGGRPTLGVGLGDLDRAAAAGTASPRTTGLAT